ncbi:phage associated protein [Neisseria gonorrhoeae]|uniref:Phage associated protein n=1 Tax=Neisseria gonorrhoeae TaxID=485 RepID=A0A378W0P7_NEIGO|nr:phage associated protein [Neisseria gonorrhoeae]
MELTVHFNAEQDLDRLFEKDEEAVGYLENVIAMIQADSAILTAYTKTDTSGNMANP